MEKSELLNELKIDRNAPGRSAKPYIWFLVIAVLGGVSFVGWFVWQAEAPPVVSTFSALSSSAASTQNSETILNANGYVVARNQATVSSRIPARVVSVLVEEGMFVEANQLLATLDDSIFSAQLRVAESQLASAKTSVEELKVQIKQADLDYSRTKNLVERELQSVSELDRAELGVAQLNVSMDRARAQVEIAEGTLNLQREYLKDMEVRAPFAGVVVAKTAQPGEMIAPVAGGGFTRTGICTIVDMDSLEIEIDVNESFINRVKPGQQVTAQLDAYKEFKLPAEVIAIIPTADRARSTVRVRVKFLQRDDRVLPDMGVKVEFLEIGQQAEWVDVPKGVLIPSSALVDDAGRTTVWVVKESIVSERKVSMGDVEGNNIRVEEGLRSGEKVVTNLTPPLLAVLSDGLEVKIED